MGKACVTVSLRCSEGRACVGDNHRGGIGDNTQKGNYFDLKY